MSLAIRPIEKKDIQTLCQMTYELAEYEKSRNKCTVTLEDLERAFFTSQEGSPKAFVCEHEGNAVGYIITYFNFSSYLGKKGLYLEDLYIRPQYRRSGFGKMALSFLADFALKNGCCRVEWSVLKWNTPALEFYKSSGAEPMSDRTAFRLSGDNLKTLAEENTVKSYSD